MTTTHHDCRRTTDAAAGGRTGAWSQILRISGRRRLRGALRNPWSESACSATIRSRRRAGGPLWVMQSREMNYSRHDGSALQRWEWGWRCRTRLEAIWQVLRNGSSRLTGSGAQW